MIERRRHPLRPPADIDHGPMTVRLEHLGGVPVSQGVPTVKFGTIVSEEQKARHRRWLARQRHGADL